jgi:hypothetical protein
MIMNFAPLAQAAERSAPGWAPPLRHDALFAPPAPLALRDSQGLRATDLELRGDYT